MILSLGKDVIEITQGIVPGRYSAHQKDNYGTNQGLLATISSKTTMVGLNPVFKITFNDLSKTYSETVTLPLDYTKEQMDKMCLSNLIKWAENQPDSIVVCNLDKEI